MNSKYRLSISPANCSIILGSDIIFHLLTYFQPMRCNIRSFSPGSFHLIVKPNEVFLCAENINFLSIICTLWPYFVRYLFIRPMMELFLFFFLEKKNSMIFYNRKISEHFSNWEQQILFHASILQLQRHFPNYFHDKSQGIFNWINMVLIFFSSKQIKMSTSVCVCVCHSYASQNSLTNFICNHTTPSDLFIQLLTLFGALFIPNAFSYIFRFHKTILKTHKSFQKGINI